MWIIKPKRLFSIGINGFYYAAKLDRTVWQHLIFGSLIGIAQGLFCFSFIGLIGMTIFLTKEVCDSWGTEEFVGIDKCRQGFDLLDLSSGITGIILAFFIVKLIMGVF